MSEQTEAETMVEIINVILDERGEVEGINIKREAGIVKVTFPDGSYMDFTEPMAKKPEPVAEIPGSQALGALPPPVPMPGEMSMASHTQKQIKAAKVALRKRILGKPWLRGLGLSHQAVQVRISSEEFSHLVPEEQDGIPVETVVVGEITLRGAMPTENE